MAATGLRRLAAVILLGAAACAFVEPLSPKGPSSGARSGAVSSSKGSPLPHAAHALPSGRDAWQMVSSACLAALLLGASCAPAWAESKRVVGEIPASGFIFKDTINVETFEDPKVSGVTLYISDFSRSVADRVTKAFVEPLSPKGPSSGAVSSSKGSPLPHAAHALPSGRNAWQMVSSACLAALLLGASCAPAWAESKRVVAEIPASGFIFKDTLNVIAFEDPKVSGVTLYISDFSRSVADRVTKGDMFAEPGAAGLTCAKNGPVKIAADLKASKEGEDVFTEARKWRLKKLKVKRVYDADAKNILYVVFTERLDAEDDENMSRYKSQVCAVHVDGVRRSRR